MVINEHWNKLYEAALAVTNDVQISEHINVGSVGAAVLSKTGNIYTGICIDTDCSLGMCAERNAMSTMFTHGEFEIDKVCSVYKDGTVMPPCGACREFMMQTGDYARTIQVLVDRDRFVQLWDLMPEYPG